MFPSGTRPRIIVLAELGLGEAAHAVTRLFVLTVLFRLSPKIILVDCLALEVCQNWFRPSCAAQFVLS